MAQTSKEGDEYGGDERGTHYTIQKLLELCERYRRKNQYE